MWMIGPNYTTIFRETFLKYQVGKQQPNFNIMNQEINRQRKIDYKYELEKHEI
jgi:hypothetical protein